jgi:hypothetical protein
MNDPIKTIRTGTWSKPPNMTANYEGGDPSLPQSD